MRKKRFSHPGAGTVTLLATTPPVPGMLSISIHSSWLSLVTTP